MSNANRRVARIKSRISSVRWRLSQAKGSNPHSPSVALNDRLDILCNKLTGESPTYQFPTDLSKFGRKAILRGERERSRMEKITRMARRRRIEIRDEESAHLSRLSKI